MVGGMRMKTVIYLDILLITNFAAAGALLAAAGLLCGTDCRALRLILASLCAACSSLILFAPTLALPLQLIYQAATAACIVLVAFGWKGRRFFLRLTVWYFLLNMLLAGCIVLAAMQGFHFVQTNNLACYCAVSPLLLFACSGGIYVLLRVILWLFGKPAGAAVCCRIRPQTQGWGEPFTAYYDTGFFAQDIFSERAVLLLYYPLVRHSIPPGWRAYLDEALQRNGPLCAEPPAALHVHFVACRTVSGNILLPGLPVSGVAVSAANGSSTVPNVLLLFSADLPPDARHEALFGPSFYEKLGNKECCI